MSDASMYTVSLDRVANQPVSEGIHPFQISDVAEGESSSQNPMWTVRLTCLSEGADEGKEATLWLVLIDSMRWKLEKFFDATNAPTTGTVTAKQFIGRKFKAQVTHEKDKNGQMRANIGEMFPFTSGPAPKSSGGPVNTQRVRGASAAPVARTGTAAKVKVKGGLPADATDGDIPFETE